MPENPPQLHPWLVPHSMQTPQAPARMTLSLPQTEHVMPMKILPSAVVTRYDEVPAPLLFPSDVPPVPAFEGWAVITSTIPLSPVRARAVSGRVSAVFAKSGI